MPMLFEARKEKHKEMTGRKRTDAAATKVPSSTLFMGRATTSTRRSIDNPEPAVEFEMHKVALLFLTRELHLPKI